MLIVSVGGMAQTPASEGNSDDTPREIDLKSGIHPPQLIEKEDATFSDEARAKNINGRCSVRLIVDANGNPQQMKIAHCTDPAFEQSSLRAVSHYKFKPATTAKGYKVPVIMTVDIRYRLGGAETIRYPIRFGFFTSPGTTTTAPDANGTYPLTKAVTPPTLRKFSNQGWGDHAFDVGPENLCKVVLTIGTDGKASNGVVSFCQTDSLAESAMKSLLASQYRPATLNAKPVAVRTLVHLESGDTPVKP